jgi:uracil-DNA glycosylase
MCGICLCDVFATNTYPGLIKGDENIGKFPGGRDKKFQAACQQFLAEQIRVVRPALIVTLGKYVPPVLARLSPDLRCWRNAKSFKELNDESAVIRRAVFRDAGHTATVVSLLHPSMRGSNFKLRSYRGYVGDKAEQTMLEDAWSASQESL